VISLKISTACAFTVPFRLFKTNMPGDISQSIDFKFCRIYNRFLSVLKIMKVLVNLFFS